MVVEKILGSDELLREDWSIHGTSGYDFLNQINGLFIETAAEQAFTHLYQEWVPDYMPFTEAAYQNKNLSSM